MKLTRIEIKDVYNIKNANLDLSDGCALVVGPNGCGKTNIIKCIVRVLEKAYGDSNDVFEFQEMPLDTRSEYSFINLHFNFTESERKIFLQLRMIAIATRVVTLCELINSQMLKYKVINRVLLEEKFENRCLPLLLKLFNSSCANLGEERKRRNSADLMVSEYEPLQEFRGIENCKKRPYVLNVELPDRTKEEAKIISDFVKEEFGGSAIQLTLSDLRARYSADEEVSHKRVEEIIDDIIEHSKFSLFECSKVDGVSGIYHPTHFLCGLRSSFPNLGYEYRNQNLYKTLMRFLVDATCILPQDRGFSTDEEGCLFWNLQKSEEKIVEAYLWEQGSEKCNQLIKIKEAMLFIAGLELDVAKYPSSKLQPRSQANSKEAYVILREFNKVEWRKLSEVSGGQRELLMILSAIHLSNADNVFLDEPGHSLHPPKQAQLRRWFEIRREWNQVLFAISHSPDMISPHWLGCLYHMSPDEDGYSTACLKKLPRENGDDNAADIESSQTNLNTSLSEVVRQSSLVVDSAAGSSSPDNEVNEPPSKRRRILPESLRQVTIDVGVDIIDFLMGVHMRRLFFSSGAVFVEGDSDRRIIQALRAVELEKVDIALQDRNLSIQRWNEAHKETQMDRWDIIPISGCANWLKAYTAAEDLKIPFITVLDADVLNKKKGSKILPISSEDWEQSRLRNTVNNSKYRSDHPLKKMVEKVDQLVGVKSTGDKEIQVRKEMEKCSLWVWNNGDLEDLFFMDERVKEKLRENEQFMKTIKELSPHQPTSRRSEISALSTQENFQKNCYSFFCAQVEDLKKEFEKTMEKLKEDPQNTEIVTSLSESDCLKNFSGQVKQKLWNHVKFVEKGTKLEKEVADKGEADVTKYREAAQEQFWQKVKTTLHNKGNWKRISFELLKAMVEIAIDQEDHQLHKLWKCIKSRLISSDVKARLPTSLIQEKFTSMLHGN